MDKKRKNRVIIFEIIATFFIMFCILLSPIIVNVMLNYNDNKIAEGTDNEKIVGVWVGRIIDENWASIPYYYEFLSDGSGYSTKVEEINSNNEYETENYLECKYKYKGNDIQKIFEYSYSDGYGLEYKTYNDDMKKYIAVKFSDDWSIEFQSRDCFIMTSPLNIHYLFVRQSGSLLPDNIKTQIDK